MSIVLEQLTKRYAGHPVVREVSLQIEDGELFVLLGPSGSGKSTLLRMIAGLSDMDEGRILLHGRDVTGTSPQARQAGFVFQNYALFRNMTVAENIEFPLRIRKASRDARRRRREELLELVGLAGMGDRRPTQLSGGQQQRVALARALAHRPEVLLLDEPFGALDARIRVELRRTIRDIQRELEVTTIFVTHDQEEAFELADRLGVMNHGRLLEVGSPRELYLHPKTEFVATFLGSANLMVGECSPRGVRVGPVELPLNGEVEPQARPRRVQVLVRPEDVAVKDDQAALQWPLLGEATVESSAFVGTFERLRLRLPPLPGVRMIAPPTPFGSDYVLVEAVRSQHQARRFPLNPGDVTWVGVRRFHALAHPGMSFLVLSGGAALDVPALELGARLAERAQARVTLLCYAHDGALVPPLVQGARDGLGKAVAGLDTRTTPDLLGPAVADQAQRQPPELVVSGTTPGDGVEMAETALAAGAHHLLLVPGSVALPQRLLICVALGEPGKEDVLFAGRLARHLGAQVSVLTVLGENERNTPVHEHARRFLDASVRTLGQLGIASSPVVRFGQPFEQIQEEIAGGGHDLLVVGAPISDGSEQPRLTGVVSRLVKGATQPVLIVRSTAEAP
jgi:sulfate transport system ATP-binding protein